MSFFSSFVSDPKQSFSNSIFGFVDKKMDELRSILSGSVDITTEEYKFPEIVIVGDEKNGKSSLLENITKCKIFPKDRGYCTKRPIRFILRNAEKITFSISFSKNRKVVCSTDDEICKLITEEFSSGLSTEEIVVECSAPGNHNFEFVDLPGIKAYPEEMATSTKAITDRYLAKKNNIVILAYAATTSSEANCSTLTLLKKHGRQKDTIFVMTMLDKLGDNKDVKFAHSQKFPDFENQFYVISNGNTCEASWFKDNGISGNVTASKLLTHTEALFTDYVNKNWYKNIVANLEKQKNALASKRYALNPLTKRDENIYMGILDKIFRKIVESKNIPLIFVEEYRKMIVYGEQKKSFSSNFTNGRFCFTEVDSVRLPISYPEYSKVSLIFTEDLSASIEKEFFEKVDMFLTGEICCSSCNYSGNTYCNTSQPHRACKVLMEVGFSSDDTHRFGSCTYSQFSDALARFKEIFKPAISALIYKYLRDDRNKSLFGDLMKNPRGRCDDGYRYLGFISHDLLTNFQNYINTNVNFNNPELVKVNKDILERQKLIDDEIAVIDEKISKLSVA